MNTSNYYFDTLLAGEELSLSARPKRQVICVSSGHGFPLAGSNARIVTVGKALQAAGVGFRILHFGPCPAPGGGNNEGIYRGLRYEYTSERRPEGTLARWLRYSWALADLTRRLYRLRSSRENSAVYLYIMEGPLCLYVSALCRLLGFPVVQEMCEWFVTFPTCSRFTRWLYRKRIYSLATGFLVISRLIEDRVRERSESANPKLLIYRLPAIVDSQRFVDATPLETGAMPAFVWCGVGYVRDVLFLIRVLAVVHRRGYRCDLRIVSGNYTGWGPEDVLNYAAEQGLPPDALVLMGRVDDQTLEACYKSATALLLPLWDDDKSRTRMPNKLAEYLASGRPVVTCGVGDLLDFLTDGLNAYIAKPGSEEDFAAKMIAVLENPVRASQIGAAGQDTCVSDLDYRAYSGRLSNFFLDCIERFNQQT